MDATLDICEGTSTHKTFHLCADCSYRHASYMSSGVDVVNGLVLCFYMGRRNQENYVIIPQRCVLRWECHCARDPGWLHLKKLIRWFSGIWVFEVLC